ncbi:MAG: IS21 family transposase [Gemmatimonadales bacterium]
MITEQQYRRLMKNHRENGGVVSHAALRAGMDRKTAAQYLKGQQSPGERQRQTGKRTRGRPDPLAGGLWAAALSWLEPTPEIDAKTLFEHLLSGCQEWVATAGGALRTFQRRVKEWRELNGPSKEVYFPQIREPGKCLQFDWTRVKEKDFAVTIAGQPFKHLLTHTVLPYSNWEWATPCLSESGLSLKRGIQEALWQLGGTPPVAQTDQSSAATHQISREDKKRTFNAEYLAFCKHLGVEPRSTHVRCPDENGDVEAAQGHLKRRLKNHLILRGSSDFKDESAYAAFVAKVCRGANALRAAKLAEEVPLLKALPARRYPETEEVTALVTGASVIHVKKTPYSVPSRLIGATVTVQLSETEVDIYRGGTRVLGHPRSQGRAPTIDYRHVIDWLVRKPGAFRHYIYRESLFPDLISRQAYEHLTMHAERCADKHYLQLLQLAAEGSEAQVSAAIAECLRAAQVPLPERIEAAIGSSAELSGAVTSLKPFQTSLARYNALLGAQVCS